MTLISYTFDGVTQSRVAQTFCTGCDKKLKRAVSRQYFRNGFHNESETRKQNDIEIAAEVAELEKTGTTCKNCDDIAANVPILKRINKDKYEAYDRKKPQKLLGTINRVVNGGWVKWRTPKDRKYSGHRNLADAAEHLRDARTPSKKAK